MVGGATPLHPSIINPTISEHLEDTGFFSLKALGSKKWQLLHLPFNRAGSHLPSWNSKLLGREWGGEEGHTHTHPADPDLCVWKLSLSRDLFSGG